MHSMRLSGLSSVSRKLSYVFLLCGLFLCYLVFSVRQTTVDMAVTQYETNSRGRMRTFPREQMEPVPRAQDDTLTRDQNGTLPSEHMNNLPSKQIDTIPKGQVNTLGQKENKTVSYGEFNSVTHERTELETLSRKQINTLSQTHIETSHPNQIDSSFQRQGDNLSQLPMYTLSERDIDTLSKILMDVSSQIQINKSPQSLIDTVPNGLVDTSSKSQKDTPPLRITVTLPQKQVNTLSQSQMDTSPLRQTATFPQRRVDTLSQSQKDMPPQNQLDTLPLRQVESSLQRHFDTSSQRQVDTAPQKQVEMPPQRQDNIPSQRQMNTSPANQVKTPSKIQVETPPQRQVKTPPQKQVETSPQRQVDTSLQRQVDIPSQKHGDTSPQKQVDTPPQRQVVSSLQKQVDTSPQSQSSSPDKSQGTEGRRMTSDAAGSYRLWNLKCANPNTQLKWCKTATPEDILQIKLPPFLKEYKNPCWRVQQLGEGAPVIRCMPYFFLAGAPKSGTTDLYARLIQHPQISSMVKKEIHWFTRRRFAANKKDLLPQIPMFSNYTDLFLSADKDLYSSVNGKGYHDKIFGDSSVSTLWDNTDALRSSLITKTKVPRTAECIHHLNPRTKFVSTVRNPVERTYSDYLYFGDYEKSQSLFHEGVTKNIEFTTSCLKQYSLDACIDYMKLNETNIRLYIGIYYFHFREFFKFFPKDQFIVLKLEDYSTHMPKNLAKVFDFLGLDPLSPQEMEHVSDQSTIVNTRPASGIKLGDMWPETRKLLTDFFRPFNEELGKLLGQYYNYNKT